jgi:peptide/nickel transport system permease protein
MADRTMADRVDERRRRKTPRTAAATLGVIIVGCVLAGALFPGWLSPYDPNAQSLGNRLLPPGTRAPEGGAAWLGTDGLGRDILSRVIHGCRWATVIGAVAVIVRGTLGTTLGLLAGYVGRGTDAVVMRLADIQLAVPFLILALAIVAAFGATVWNIVLALGATGWVTYARIVRGQVFSLRHREYVEAARAIGATTPRLLVRHLLPAIVPSVTVIASAEIGQMILAEASLSFLGLGLPPAIPTWGTMVADGRDLLSVAWWVSTIPGIALFATVLGFSLLGDWLRDVLDPSLR